MKVAFSIVSVNGESLAVPDYARIIVEFSNSDNSQIAQLQINASNKKLNFVNNRYIIGEKTLGELFYNVGNQFSWLDVSSIRVYASATNRLAITNKAASLGKATITTESNHNLSPGDYVSVFGVDNPSRQIFDGFWQVTETTPTTFSYESEIGNPIEKTASGIDEESTITVNDSTNLLIGMLVEGVGIATGTVISDIVGNVVTLSLSLTETLTDTIVTFFERILTTVVSPNGTAEVTNKDYYLALDAIRMDNISTVNPLYGLAGYSIIQNRDALTTIKSPNTNNYIEYRFILDVT
jgi:hypothetical protein